MSTLKAINLQHPSATNPAIVLATDGSAAGNFSSSNGGPLAGFRNRIINGNFDIWQRGTSFTGDKYGADRWIHGRVGTTHTATRQPFTLGQTDVPGEPTYFCSTVVSSEEGAANYSVLAQYIEDVRTFAGQQVTVSFWAKVDSTKNIAVELLQNFGSGGSPSAIVRGIGSTKVSIGTSWQKVTVTATVPSISGKTLGTDGNSAFQLSIIFDAGSDFNAFTDSLGQQSGTFDIAQVQIEPGPVATPFEQRPIGTELALCQRYYEIIQTVRELASWYSSVGTTDTFRQCINFLVQKRVTPTIVNGTFGLANTTLNSTTANTQGYYRVWNSTSAGQSAFNMTSESSASAEL